MSAGPPPLVPPREEDAQDSPDAERPEGLELLGPVRSEITSLPASLGQFPSENALAPSEAAPLKHTADWPQYAQKDFLQNYIPSTDPDDHGAKTFENRLSKRKNMLRLRLGMSVLVVVVNVSITTWLWTTHPPVRGTGTLFTGDCTLASFINSGSHVLLNILSTAFLGAGNYCMQVLVTPSREEIEASHKAGRSLDIGKQSIYNVFRIHWSRRLTWIALGIVSTILHLIWNSTFFSSLPVVGNPTAVVTNDFLQVGDDWSKTNPGQAAVSAPRHGLSVVPLHHEAREFTYMSNAECIATFINPLNVTRTLMVVTNESSVDQGNSSSLLLGFIGHFGSLSAWDIGSEWICSAYAASWKYCSLNQALSFEYDWKIQFPRNGQWSDAINATVNHCLVGEAADQETRCAFHYSAYLLLAVCVCTTVASILVALVAFVHNRPTIVLTGDALESFLEEPEDLQSKTGQSTLPSENPDIVALEVRRWIVNGQGPRWFSAASKKTWLVSIPALTAEILATACLFVYAVWSYRGRVMGSSFSSFWQQGLGRTQPYALLSGVFMKNDHYNLDSLGHVLFANWFQLLISLYYLFYNNILTCQLAAREFTQYFTRKDSLRVNTPKNITQRSSHFLSLPFEYAIPLALSSIVLHWLVSQSVFIVQTTAYGPGSHGQRIPEDNTTRVGWSMMGILLSMLWGILLMSALVVNSFRRYPGVPNDFPSMATNSSALSACCQRPPDDHDAYLFPVTIGVVPDLGQPRERCSGRLTFTSYLDVKKPELGATYELPTWRSRSQKKEKKQ